MDASTFDAQSQADFLSMMTENLEILEKIMYQLKALLKEPDFIIFEEVKAAELEKLRGHQGLTNPGRPNTTAMNDAITKKN